MIHRFNIVGKIKSNFHFIKHSPLHERANGSFIFIHINKTAGVSIANALKIDTKKHYKRHYTAKEAIERIGWKKWNKAYKFSIVRNPFAKVFSQYNHRVKTNQNKLAENTISFNDWVVYTYGEEKKKEYYDKPRMFLPQVEWLKDMKDMISFDHIIKFENLQADFQKVTQDLGVNVQLPHLNKSTNDNYQSAYNQASIDTISHWFREDLNYFNYQF